MALSNPWLVKAERSLQAAQLLLEHDDLDFAVSRTYYAYFYVATALLKHQQLEFSSHAAVIAQFGRVFALPETLPRKYHAALSNLFQQRQLADYVGDANTNLDLDTSTAFIQLGHEFIRDADQYMGSSTLQG